MQRCHNTRARMPKSSPNEGKQEGQGLKRAARREKESRVVANEASVHRTRPHPPKKRSVESLFPWRSASMVPMENGSVRKDKSQAAKFSGSYADHGLGSAPRIWQALDRASHSPCAVISVTGM